MNSEIEIEKEAESLQEEESMENIEQEAVVNEESAEEILEEQKEMELAFEQTEEASSVSKLDFTDLERPDFSMELKKKVIESLLFISDKAMGIATLVSAFGQSESGEDFLTRAEVEEALQEYEQDLISEDRGFRLHHVNGAYQLRSSEDMKEYVQNTIKARSFRLTGPSLETLAMVAYKQPITKSQVDEIRGVDSSHLLRALMDRGLVAFAGKSELPGKPMLYKTTAKFLEVFDLRSIKELPSWDEIEALIPEGIGEEEEEKQSLSDLTGKLSEDFDGSYSAGEEELGKITNQLSDISTSTEFFEEEKKREKERREAEKAESLREALMLEEEVSDRDKKWLERYEEKLKALEEEAAGGLSEEEPGEVTEATQESESQEPLEATSEVLEDKLEESEAYDFDGVDEEEGLDQEALEEQVREGEI